MKVSNKVLRMTAYELSREERAVFFKEMYDIQNSIIKNAIEKVGGWKE